MKKPKREESENPPAEEGIVLEWWAKAIDDAEAPAGPRAELRRAATLEEVVFTPLYHDLRRRLAGTRWRAVDRLALVAGVLSHVRAARPSETFAAQLAAPRSGSRLPQVTPSRFRRMLRIGDSADQLDDLFQLARRAVRLVDREANVTDLSASLYWWNANTRKRWALDYYARVDEQRLAGE